MQKHLTTNDLLNGPLRYFLYFLLLIPAFFFRDFSPPNELKYFSIVDEALRNNTWFTFYNHGEIYADKPPLFFWLMMLAKIITGKHIMWIIGLFSLIPAIGIIIVMDKWFKKFSINHNPLVSNILLLTTTMFASVALFIRMDMLMTFFIVLAFYTFFKIYKNEHLQAEKWLLPIYIFLAIFSKGAMGFLIPTISITIFLIISKQIKTFGKYLGFKQWAILVVLCVIWFSMVYAEGGNDYLQNILFKQTVGRGVNAFHHKAPFWFYFPRMLWAFAPWTLLCITLIIKGIYKKMFNSDIHRFFAVIIISTIVMLSIVSSKLDIYLLPIYPFVIYLCSTILYTENQNKSLKIVLYIQSALFALFLPTFFVAKKYIPYDFSGILPYIGITILSGAGVLSIWLIIRNKTIHSIICLGFGLLFLINISSFIIPQFNKYIGFREMAEAAENKAKFENIDRYAYYKFYTAQNIDVYLHTKLECINSVEQLDSLNRLQKKTILFVRARELRRDNDFREWIQTEEPEWKVGDYSWYIVGN